MINIKKAIGNIIASILIYGFILILIAIYIYGIYGTIHAIQTKNKAVEVEATISNVTKNTYWGKYGKETTYSADVKYTYKDKEYNEYYQYYSPSNDEGDVITITINSENPKDILNFKKELSSSLIIVIIFTLLLLVWIKQIIRNKELKKHGIDIKDKKAVEEYFKAKKNREI